MAALSGFTAFIDFSNPHKPNGPWCGWKTCHGCRDSCQSESLCNLLDLNMTGSSRLLPLIMSGKIIRWIPAN